MKNKKVRTENYLEYLNYLKDYIKELENAVTEINEIEKVGK